MPSVAFEFLSELVGHAKRSKSQSPWNDSKVISPQNLRAKRRVAPAPITAQIVPTPRCAGPATFRLGCAAEHLSRRDRER